MRHGFVAYAVESLVGSVESGQKANFLDNDMHFDCATKFNDYEKETKAKRHTKLLL